MTTLYQTVASDLKRQIQNGTYMPGSKLPAIREMSKRGNYSVATIIAAYRLLEDEGYIHAKAKSGYFVKHRKESGPIKPLDLKAVLKPQKVSVQHIASALSKAAADPRIIKLGAAVPAHQYLPVRAVERALQKVGKYRNRLFNYEVYAGAPELRYQLARRMADTGYIASPDEIIVTNGCQEALCLALRVTTKPGDIVAVESPTYFGLLQLIESLGLRTIEIPTDQKEGISLTYLSEAVRSFDVKACVIIPNFNNPVGSLLSDDNKAQLSKILSEKGVTIIEDDTYGDLYFGENRPRSIMSFDSSADVIYCGSFSKTISPDLRIGWIVSKLSNEKLEHLKFMTNVSVSSINQLVVSDVIQSGKYDRHLRKVRVEYEHAIQKMAEFIYRYFPERTQISQPKGGFVLWVELPENVNSAELARLALDQGISITPGHIFSSSNKYHNCIRLSCAVQWTPQVERALITLGSLAKAITEKAA